MQRLDTLNRNGLCTLTRDLRTHGIQEIGQINNFRLLSAIFKHRRTLSQGRRHKDMLGAANSAEIEPKSRTLKPAIHRGFDVTLVHLNRGAQRL